MTDEEAPLIDATPTPRRRAVVCIVAGCVLLALAGQAGSLQVPRFAKLDTEYEIVEGGDGPQVVAGGLLTTKKDTTELLTLCKGCMYPILEKCGILAPTMSVVNWGTAFIPMAKAVCYNKIRTKCCCGDDADVKASCAAELKSKPEDYADTYGWEYIDSGDPNEPGDPNELNVKWGGYPYEAIKEQCDCVDKEKLDLTIVAGRP